MHLLLDIQTTDLPFPNLFSCQAINFIHGRVLLMPEFEV